MVANSVATLHMDSSELSLNIFAASLQATSSGAAVTVVALRTERLTARIARVLACANEVLAKREGRHHGLAEQHASRCNVILIVQLFPYGCPVLQIATQRQTDRSMSAGGHEQERP